MFAAGFELRRVIRVANRAAPSASSSADPTSAEFPRLAVVRAGMMRRLAIHGKFEPATGAVRASSRASQRPQFAPLVRLA
jgi:hypothetical protein